MYMCIYIYMYIVSYYVDVCLCSCPAQVPAHSTMDERRCLAGWRRWAHRRAAPGLVRLRRRCAATDFWLAALGRKMTDATSVIQLEWSLFPLCAVCLFCW